MLANAASFKHSVAPMQAASKSHKSAICIIPPLQLTQAVQRLRFFRDKSFVRWPPHVNLLYPFIDDQGDAFQIAAVESSRAIAAIAPFKLKLSSLSYFSHGPRSYTMWMKPDDGSGLQAVQAALQTAFPAYDDLSNDPGRGISSFTPHLSLGQWQDKQQLLEDMQLIEDEVAQLEFDVTEVCLISRKGYLDPFTVRYAVPLGTSTGAAAFEQPQLLDIPYVATIGPHSTAAAAAATAVQQIQHTAPSSTQQQQQYNRSKFGLGACPTGVWNFAYGANMSPRKLGGSRGLHPVESQPGVLKGFKLEFNHRGGFGNLVQVAAMDVAAAPVKGSANAAGESSSVAKAIQAGGTFAQQEVHAEGSPAHHEVHGVLHRLTPVELATLTGMEHEYWPVEVLVEPYTTPASSPNIGNTAAAAAAAAAGKADRTTAADLVLPAEPTAAQQQQQQQQPGSQLQQQSPAQQQQQPNSQQQQPTLAVAFISPPERCIQSGLPPIKRYLDLLVEGARHWKLDEGYTAWLATHPTVAGDERTDAYYTSPTGLPLTAWPKIRTGSQQKNQRGGSRGFKRQYGQKSAGRQEAASGQGRE